MPKTVYQYDPNTREYVGPVQAWENPQAKLDGIPFNIPRACAEDAPPPPKDGFAIIRDGNEWGYVEDHRGQPAYSTADKSSKIVTELGKIPDDCTLKVPGQFDVWKKSAWITDTNAQAAAEKLEQNNVVKAALNDIDLYTIRSLREWVAAQPNAPQFLLDHEKAAQAQRVKLQK